MGGDSLRSLGVGMGGWGSVGIGVFRGVSVLMLVYFLGIVIMVCSFWKFVCLGYEEGSEGLID